MAHAGARWLTLAQLFRLLAQVLTLVILSRLLSPSTYGTMAIAGIFITFAMLVRDAGLGSSIVQKGTASDEFVNSVFWATLFIGLTLSISIIALAAPIENFFSAPHLSIFLYIVGAGQAISALSIVPQSILERRQDFRAIAICDIASQALGVTIAITLAKSNAKEYSLPSQYLLTSIINTAGLLIASNWRPKISFHPGELWATASYGSQVLAFNFLNFGSRNLDSFLLGKIFGTHTLGAYSVAYKVMLIPMTAITTVFNRTALPSLSRAANDLNAARVEYIDVVIHVAGLSFPLMATIWLTREALVPMVFGSQWSQAVLILSYLAPVGALQSVGAVLSPLLLSQARADKLLYVGLFSAAINISAFLAGSTTDFVWFLRFVAVAATINCCTAIYVAAQALSCKPFEIVNRPLKIAASTAIMIAVAELIETLNPRFLSHSHIVSISSIGFIGLATYAASLYVLDRATLLMLTRFLNPIARRKSG